MPEWIIESVLAGSARPGRELGSRANVPRLVVDRWLEGVKRMEIRSIICLLGDEHLPLYSEIPEGLIAYYCANGLHVKHIPVPDYQVPPLSSGELTATWEAFQRLPQPVLVHCSAGVGRTGAAAQYLLEQLGQRTP